jgi:lysophospholipase L1-like esterase
MRSWRGTFRTAVAAALAALLLIAPAARADGEGGVLVVGDSLEELTSPYLEKYLRGIPLTVNAVGGSNSYEILDLFERSYDPSQSVIVFDAGTNDNPNYPQILAENVRKVAATVGNRCIVLPTIHGFTVEGTGNQGKNRAVARFAAERLGTQVPDWAAAVHRDPGLLQADGLHPTPEGSDYRAQLIAQGVLGCLSYTETAATRATEPEVEVTRMKPVDRLARRESELRELALRRAAAEVYRQLGVPAA